MRGESIAVICGLTAILLVGGVVMTGHFGPNPLMDIIVERPPSVPDGARPEWNIYDGIQWRKCVAHPMGALSAAWLSSAAVGGVVIEPGGNCQASGAHPGLWISQSVGSPGFFVSATNLRVNSNDPIQACAALRSERLPTSFAELAELGLADRFGTATPDLKLASRVIWGGKYRLREGGSSAGGVNCDLDLTG